MPILRTQILRANLIFRQCKIILAQETMESDFVSKKHFSQILLKMLKDDSSILIATR